MKNGTQEVDVKIGGVDGMLCVNAYNYMCMYKAYIKYIFACHVRYVYVVWLSVSNYMCICWME